jgi:NADPH-dependent glutamate synthase beta subunit-like oxidoreductase
LVIGGGNVAIDAARVAIRLGASEVNVACLEGREAMPAFDWEIRKAEEEGVKIDCSLGPQSILNTANKACGVHMARVKAIERDEAGKIKPTFLTGGEKVIDADIVVVAIGQAASLASLGTDLKVNPRTLMTNLPGVYAGGDVVSGPSMVVKAMASGKNAARYIHRYLNSKPEYLELVRKHSEKLSPEEYRSHIRAQKSHPTREVSPDERIKDFRDIGKPYTQRNAEVESRRCVRRRVCSEYYDET